MTVVAGQEPKEIEAADRPLEPEDLLPRSAEMNRVVIEDVLGGRAPGRVLDLGTGDGRMIAELRREFPRLEAVGLDASPGRLGEAHGRFCGQAGIELRLHELSAPLPSDLGRFDLVISAWAIHHLPNERKRSLYREACDLLNPGGVFCNLDLVLLPSVELQSRALAACSAMAGDRDAPPAQPTPILPQLRWLCEAGLINVDCHWKWLAAAIMAGERPAA